MKMLKNNIMLQHPDVMVLCSKGNEKQTEDDIEQLGIRLADEVKQYVRENCPGTMMSKINFIGYSLGGVVIRAALKHLSSLRDRMNAYMSLSSPHLGCTNSKSTLVSTGIWIIKNLKKTCSLSQLTLSDSTDPHSSYMYTLSECT